MRVAIIKNGRVENIAEFRNIEHAISLYPDYVCINADGIYCNIGWIYTNGILSEDNSLPTDPFAPIDWKALENELRNTSIWAKVFMLACSDLTANALFTLLYGSLFSSHNVSDLTFSIRSIRLILSSTGNDFTQVELNTLKDLLNASNLDPSLINI